MKVWFNFIYNKLRYDSVSQNILNALKLIRIYIYPYYIYQENINATRTILNNSELPEYKVGMAEEGDMQQILRFPDRMDRLETLIARLKNGDLCVAAWYAGKIVAFSWVNLRLIEFNKLKYKLNDNEAYLYDAYTVSSHRGKKLSYLLRNRLYEVLKEKGRSKFYSITIKSNKSAVKFKRNINAIVIDSGLLITFFNKWQYHKEILFEKSRIKINK